MKAQSHVYVQLQNIYKNKARRDVDEILSTIQEDPHGKNIERSEVEAFCKNAAFLKLIRGPPSSSNTLVKLAGLSDRIYCSFYM